MYTNIYAFFPRISNSFKCFHGLYNIVEDLECDKPLMFVAWNFGVETNLDFFEMMFWVGSLALSRIALQVDCQRTYFYLIHQIEPQMKSKKQLNL